MKRIQTMATFALVTVLVAVTSAITGCTNSGDKAGQSSQKDVKNVQYTCSMHPEVVQNKPGDCPKCGMKLVEKH